MKLAEPRPDGHYWVRVDSLFHDDGKWDVAQVEDGFAYLPGLAHEDYLGARIIEWGPRLDPPP